MSLLNDILAWSKSLKPWQQDALRRLFQQHELSKQDYDDLYAMLKSAGGLPDSENRQPVPLAQEHLPVSLSSTSHVILKSLRDLKNVNRIAADQKLDFSPKGITVVYGDNGSGKSGYSRVFKRACRARDSSEIIHTNVYDPKTAQGVPEAIFDVEIGGELTALTWKQGTTPPDELSTVAVFDSRCARAYIDAEQDAAYVPYGLDIVENLGQQVLPSLSKRLDDEIQSINTDVTPFVDLQGSTAVGMIMSSLSAATNPATVTKLGTLTAGELARLSELDKTLAESDPKAKAKELRLSAKRINELMARIDTATNWVNDTAVEKLRRYDSEAEDASKAEAIAADAFRAGDCLLSGTGEQVWKNLFEAARRFSTEAAYPASDAFPYLGPDAKCVLCQQPLSQDAAGRMRRFEDYVKQDTATVAAAKREQVSTAEKKIAEAVLTFGLDAAITEELEQIGHSLLLLAQEFEKKIEARKDWMLSALKTHAWTGPPVLEADPRPDMKSLSDKLVTDAAELERVADEQQRKALEKERAELHARKLLSHRLQSVLDMIDRMHKKSRLNKCKDCLKTRGISHTAKQFASEAVTGSLRSALNEEFKVLGVGHIKTRLNERVVQTKTRHKLVLDLPTTVNLHEILSEGEQRVIAIGSFLAELRQADHNGAIIFDDPVSSLDHHWRGKVAQRLVAEAKRRQVIIMTHDTVFLGELLEAAKQDQVDVRVSCLEWFREYAGSIQEGLPWRHKPYKERLDALEKSQESLAHSSSPYLSEDQQAEIQKQYSLLRATIERIIQDVVFSGVVERYSDHMRVNKLSDVVGFTEDECSEILRLYKVCCDATEAHDHSSVKNAPAPTAAQLGDDIARLKSVVKAINTRRKNQNAVSTHITK